MEALTEGVPIEIRSCPMAAESAGDPVPFPGKEHYEKEIESLVRVFNEEEGLQVVVGNRKDRDSGSNIQRKKIAAFLEGSRLKFSALVIDIFEKLGGESDQDQSKNGAVTMALVKSSVLSLGERLSFGITSPDADVLEDDTPRSLWCWEVRDVKLLSKGLKDEVLDRRRWRKKIGERIAALSATLDALRKVSLAAGEAEIEQRAANLKEQREALAKVDDESAIRAAKNSREIKISESSSQTSSNPLGEQPNNAAIQEAPSSKRRRSGAEEKERIRQEKELKRQQVESKKEQKRKEKEESDRKKQQQKQQDEAEREQKRKEKEEGERKKQEKKLQDEAEKEQKREAERKKQLALKKQASFMDRFLVRKDPPKDSAKSPQSCDQTQPQTEPQTSLSPIAELGKREFASPSGQSQTATVVVHMDAELKGCNASIELEELWRSHLNNWLQIRTQAATRTSQRWGVRRKPKVSVFSELRLTGTVDDSRGNNQDDGQTRTGAANSSYSNSSPVSNLKRSREEFDSPESDGNWKENVVEECLSPSSPFEEGKKSATSRYQQLRNKTRKLLQFDKSHRPPYYGTFSRTSEYIKPRQPLKQDPALDYEVDSDEEWEEEDPGESLSDVEKDEEEDEKGEIEELEDDEDGPDEFVVPDGYLSEDEGVASEKHSEQQRFAAATESPATPVPQSVMSLERLRKVLDNATEHAIRSNHPLVISNLGKLHDCDEDVSTSQFPSNRTETMCLEALRMRALVPNLLIGAW
ncbi:unnamed protein product [Calypogeia fissa]